MADSDFFNDEKSKFLRIDKNIPTRFTGSIRTGITEFFKNQPNFDIRTTSVITAATPLGVDQAVINGLCDMQRTLAFASTLDEFQALVNSDLTSSFKIASMSVTQLINKINLSTADAQGIHDRATTLSNHNQSALTSMFQAGRGTGIAVIDGGVSEKGRLNILGSIGGNTVKNINLEELFGAMDSDPCDDCNSVTSPAAYFVEILQFLRNKNLEPGNKHCLSDGNNIRGTILERLFARRPDLGDLQLTCPNTTAIVPYIDLANEVMQSFVVHLDEQTPGNKTNVGRVKLDVYNTDGTAGELLSEPQHTNYGAYSILSTKLYPFHKLPYNQALDEARTFLNYLGTSRYELLKTCYPWTSTPEHCRISEGIEDKKGSDDGDERSDADAAMIAEYLNLTHEEYSAITGIRCVNCGPEMEDEWKYWGYDTESLLLDTAESTHTGLMFIKAQFLPRSGIQFSDLVDLLKTEYINPMANFATRNPIVIFHHSDQDMRYRLIRSNGTGLDISDYQRIRQFIQLWHRIGWTIDEIDKAICGLENTPKITTYFLGQLVSVLKLLEITKLERSKLLTFWSPISMQGADSLYDRLILRNGAARADPVLQLDEHGYFFSLATIPQHEPLVMATLGLTKAGLDAISERLKGNQLSIENLSFLYRHGLMAKFLGVTPSVLLEMIEIFGNPFDSPVSCLEFVELWKRMGDIGFTFAQLHYVVKDVDDRANPLALSEKKIQEIMKSLLEGSAVHPRKDGQGGKLGTDLFISTVSKALGLSIETTKGLLTGIKIKKTDALMMVISFMDLEMEKQSSEFPLEAIKRAEAAKLSLKSLLSQLSRASIFISGFKLSTAEVTCVLANNAGFKGFREGELSLNGWTTVLAYSELRDSLPKGVDATLLELLKWLSPAHRAQAGSVEEKVKKIVDLMLIKKETVRCLADHFGLPGFKSYPDVALLTKLKKVSDFTKKLSIDAGSLLYWASPLADFEQTHRVAQAIQGSIRARFTKEDWGKIVKPLQDQLRQNKRDALIAYLLVQPKLIQWGVTGADSLFEFFMIDVQMGPCLETSRIKQAISTVQVFVQRCFGGLEKRYGVSNDALDQKRWEWMKNYRIWEANRKVFLYPENWIEPSLRDDKSPFFLEFEAALLKKDLDSKSMEDAVKNYISRVDEVANLLPVTLLAEGTTNEEVHLFARTRSMPYVYYYRSYDQKRFHWKAWEKMEVDIQYHDDREAVNHGGAFLIPAVIGGRLIVFTPQIIKQVKMGDGDVDVTKKLETVDYFEIKLGWSEYRNGKWTPKRLSSATLLCKSRVVLKSLGSAEKTVVQQLHQLCFSVIETTESGVDIDVSCIRDSLTYKLGRFKFTGASCGITSNEGWDLANLSSAVVGEDVTLFTTPDSVNRKNLASDHQFSMNFATNSKKEKFLTASSASWSVSDNLLSFTPEHKVGVKQGEEVSAGGFQRLADAAKIPARRIPLTHETTSGHLTHTSASATLNQLYTHLHISTQPQPAAIPLNELKTPGGLYDWELGLHAPMFLMDKLTSSQQYEKALEIARFVFDPMASGLNDSSHLAMWKWAPFWEISAQRSFRRILFSLKGDTDKESFTSAAENPFSSTFVALEKARESNSAFNYVFEVTDSSCDAVISTFGLFWAEFEGMVMDEIAEVCFVQDMPIAKDYIPVQVWLVANPTLVLQNNIRQIFPTITDSEFLSLGHAVAKLGPLGSDMAADRVQIRTVLKQIKFNDTIRTAMHSHSSGLDVSEYLVGLPPNTPDAKVNNWRNNPFQPHAIARDRPIAYMTWMVMRYIKILIAAGDQLFRRETMESMPLAIQYYTLAAHLYGPASQEIPKHTKSTPKTFNTLIGKWDAFSNAMVSFENAFPFANSVGRVAATTNTGIPLSYFCVPRNPAIRDLRTQIDDRLYKIRNCQDINGITRKLALFAPPIDPGAFVRAAAAGLSLSSVMESISGPMPNYRFQYLLRGALEMVQELKSLAGAFLSAKEKMDSEAYQRIRAGHESTINAMVLDMKKMSRDEANSAIESLRHSRQGPLCRVNYFLQLVGAEEIKTASSEYKPVKYAIEKPTGSLMTTLSEKLETTLADEASTLRIAATALGVISASILVLPTPEINTAPMGVGISLRVGPANVAEGYRAASMVTEAIAAAKQHYSDATARTNSFTRQYQDRVLQANSAGHELNSINAQIKTQEVRVRIVEKDIELQEKQIETAKATEEFLRSKYTSEALYSWQETQLRTLHYQTYNLAYDLAKKVEKSYQFERCLAGTDANFIVGGWDDSRDGLFSAEALGLGLRRLEAAYQESRGHDFEITKHISLRQIAPKALLDLRTTTSCTFSLSETLFDMDFPGHHTRRLKSVSLSLPCVVGPYTSVNCTLRMTSNSYRLGKAAETTVMQPNYVPIQSVAFSSGQNDPGVFELNFHDERYLPFEGAGVISTWDLSLPKFRAFDYNTISDVILHLRYTSIVGADNEAATARVNSHLAAGKTSDSTTGDVLYASFDLRNEFASAWQQLVSSQSMTLSNLEGRLPWWTTQYGIEVMKIELLPFTNAGFEIQIENEGEETKQVSNDGGMSFISETPIKQFGTWKLAITNPTSPWEKPKFPLTGLWMVVQYKAVVKTS